MPRAASFRSPVRFRTSALSAVLAVVANHGWSATATTPTQYDSDGMPIPAKSERDDWYKQFEKPKPAIPETRNPTRPEETTPPWLQQETASRPPLPPAAPTGPSGEPAPTAAALAAARADEAKSESGSLLMPLAIVAAFAAGVAFWRRRSVGAIAAPKPAKSQQGPLVVQIKSKFGSPTTKSGGPRKGFSILEVLVATVILAVCLMTMFGTIVGLGKSHQAARETAKVQEVAQLMAERIQGASWHRLGVPEEPWSWFRREVYPNPAWTTPGPVYWSPNGAQPAIPTAVASPGPALQTGLYNPPITLTGSGARSLFINQGLPYQEIVVVDCALESVTAAVDAQARATWSGDPDYTAATPVRGLGLFHDPPGLRNLQIFLEYYNTFPTGGVGAMNIFSFDGTVNNHASRTDFAKRLPTRVLPVSGATETYLLAVPDPANTTGPLRRIETPFDFDTVGLVDVVGSVGIRVVITWDSVLDDVTNLAAPSTRSGTRRHELVFERRK